MKPNIKDVLLAKSIIKFYDIKERLLYLADRSFAAFIDLMILFLIYNKLEKYNRLDNIASLYKFDDKAPLYIFVIIMFFYFVLFESITKQSLGKKLTRFKVKEKGKNGLSFGIVLVRNLLKMALVTPLVMFFIVPSNEMFILFIIVFLIWFLPLIFKKHQTIYDLLVNTVVVDK